MSFEWISRKPREGIATLYDTNITLNKSASSHFDNAYSVLLGLDRENKRIAIKPISKQEWQRGAIPAEKRHKITVRPSYARVSNKRFVQDVADLLGIDLSSRTPKFKANWNSEEKALIIDLNKVEEGS